MEPQGERALRFTVPPELKERVEGALRLLEERNAPARLWAHDHTLWKPDPKEIANRLGWLHAPERMALEVEGILRFVEEVRAEGFTHALLLGMGGSSLAPEMLRKTLGVREGYLDLAVLDSTHPEAVLRYTRTLDPRRTLYLVSSKSGGTVETLSFFKYFYNRAADALGTAEAGRRFAAVTDPGSRLAETGKKLGFRAVFENDPEVGGRYSALTFFGLLPAALTGADIARLLERGREGARLCGGADSPGYGPNMGAALGALMAAFHEAGRDKVHFLLSPPIASFGDWVEQLIAESTGKEGKGILPVAGGTVRSPDAYGSDAWFAYLRLAGDPSLDEAVEALEVAGHPVVRLSVENAYDLGRQFFLWETAVALAGALLQINPFDQPNVESAKKRARETAAAYEREGRLPEPEPAFTEGDIAVYGEIQAPTAAEALRTFLHDPPERSYTAVQAYLAPSSEMDQALEAFRDRLEAHTRRAATLGYGPRFLHSTGQLHKGDAGRGLFIQLTADPAKDTPIPDEPGSPAFTLTFGVLIRAQALGDYQALMDAGRRVLRLHLQGDGITRLLSLSEEV